MVVVWVKSGWLELLSFCCGWELYGGVLVVFGKMFWLELFLLEGWEEVCDFDGKVYYIDYMNCIISWIDLWDRYIKLFIFVDCISDELLLGWEEVYDL